MKTIKLLAASIVLVLGGAIVWLSIGGDEAVAFADVAKKIAECRTIFYRQTTTINGKQALEMSVTWGDPSWLRMRANAENAPVFLFDGARGEGVILMPQEKQAVKITADSGVPREANAVGAMFDSFKHFADDSVEDLAPREIDGRWTTGFRVVKEDWPIDVWVDPKTTLPIRMEMTVTTIDGEKSTSVFDEFVFHTELDESLFSLTPPAGYTVAEPMEISVPGEKDLVALLRAAAGYNGDVFPDGFDSKSLEKLFSKGKGDTSLGSGMETSMVMSRAYVFVMQLEQKGAGHWGYTGKGVTLGDADRVVCWWKPDDTKDAYRAIHGDLGIQDHPGPNPPTNSGE